MARGDNPDFRQSSFAGGEASKLMWGRNDFKKYHSSLALCKNWIPTAQGALLKRSGTQYIASTKIPSQKVRLVSFIFSNAQTFVLEFGAGYIRFYQNAQQIMAGGVPLEVATSYAAADLMQLKFAQSGDVVTIAHRNYPPMDLSRLNTAGTSWSFGGTPLLPFGIYRTAPPPALIEIEAQTPYKVYLVNPTGINTTGANAAPWSIAVTAVYDDGSESLPGWTDEITFDRTDTTHRAQFAMYVTPTARMPAYFKIYAGRGGVWGLLDTVDPAPAGQAVYTDSGDGPDFSQNPPDYPVPFPGLPGNWAQEAFFAVGQRVYVSGNTYEAIKPGIAGSVAGPAQSAGVFFDGIGDRYPWGLTVNPGDHYRFNGSVWKALTGGAPTGGSQAPTAFTWGAVVTDGAGITWQHISSGGFVTWKFVQVGQAAAQYPAVVTYQGQRRVFADVAADPTRIVGTEIGKYKSFNVNETPLDTDAIDFSLASNRYEEIRSFINLKYLLALTSERDWTVTGAGGTGSLTPSGIMAQPNNVRGASWLDPLTVGVSGLYVQALGTQIWELVFDFYTQSYLGKDVTIQAQHLFQRHQIVDWAYAPVPHSIAWCVREDGVLLGFTYVREEEIAAWHRHTTAGLFENVCTVPETINGVAETGVYVVVNRTVNGATARYVERFATRQLPVIYDADGLESVDTTQGVFLDASIVSTGTVISGLNHLTGQAVKVLADGVVCGPYTVSATGQIDMSADFTDGTVPATVIVGLPYCSDLKTLPLNPADTPNFRSNMKNVYRASVEMADTRGLAVGASFASLKGWENQRQVSDGYNPVAPFTGLEHFQIDSEFEHEGQIVIRHDMPLPATLLALGLEVNVGGD